ncbi:(2R)-phospho-3-sulfolactate synthase, ComA [Bacillus freudenreichii]|nr:(2R)-phospho-3-sulfolactate synthase, ComA [Bacillus freudenreichii]
MRFLDLPERTSGKRTYGITSIVDFGIPSKELENILYDFGHIIDIAKLGIGSAYVTPNVEKKISLYKKHDITPYCGGTLFEKAYHQNKLTEYIEYLKGLGIDWIEVSNGTIDIPLNDRLDLVSHLKKDFHVIAEVGSKDANKHMSTSDWVDEVRSLLENGCKYVITEGRDSGTSGIYDKSGLIKSELVDELLKEIDCNKIIFEAPLPKHQMYFINEIGPNVNLGNVKLSDVLILEAQRCGLRCETFFLEENKCRLPL